LFAAAVAVAHSFFAASIAYLWSRHRRLERRQEITPARRFAGAVLGPVAAPHLCAVDAIVGGEDEDPGRWSRSRIDVPQELRRKQDAKLQRRVRRATDTCNRVIGVSSIPGEQMWDPRKDSANVTRFQNIYMTELFGRGLCSTTCTEPTRGVPRPGEAVTLSTALCTALPLPAPAVAQPGG